MDQREGGSDVSHCSHTTPPARCSNSARPATTARGPRPEAAAPPARVTSNLRRHAGRALLAAPGAALVAASSKRVLF